MRNPEPPRPPNRLAAALRAHAALTRWTLALPVATAAALATTAAMPLWLPAGADGANAVALPVVAAPLTWAVPFFYACLAEDVARAAALLVAVTAAQAALVALA